MDDNDILRALKEFEARLDSRFEQIDSRFEQIDSRFERVDSRFEQIDSRFQQLESGIKELAGDVKQTQDGLKSLRRRMDRGFANVRQDLDLLRYANKVALERHVETRLDVADIVRRLMTVEQRLGIDPHL